MPRTKKGGALHLDRRIARATHWTGAALMVGAVVAAVAVTFSTKGSAR